MRFHICTRAMLLLASTSKSPSCPGQSKLQRGMFSSLPPSWSGLVWSLLVSRCFSVTSFVRWLQNGFKSAFPVAVPLRRSFAPSFAQLYRFHIRASVDVTRKVPSKYK